MNGGSSHSRAPSWLDRNVLDLRRWKLEVGQFFDGVDADPSAAELAWIAPDHPVFRIDS